MLEASPSFHFGGTFGHAGSTSNTGKARAFVGMASAACAGAISTVAASTIATLKISLINPLPLVCTGCTRNGACLPILAFAIRYARVAAGAIRLTFSAGQGRRPKVLLWLSYRA